MAIEPAGDDGEVAQDAVEELGLAAALLFGLDAGGDVDGEADGALAAGLVETEVVVEIVAGAVAADLAGELAVAAGEGPADLGVGVGPGLLGVGAEDVLGAQVEQFEAEAAGLEDGAVAIDAAGDDGKAGEDAVEQVVGAAQLGEDVGLAAGVADGALELHAGEADLAEVVGGAALEGLLVDVGAVHPGEQDDGHVGADRGGLADEVEAGAAAEAVVEEAGVVTTAVEPAYALVERLRPVEFVGLGELRAPQKHGEEAVVFLPVFHDEDFDWG